MKLDLYTENGDKKGAVNASDKIFGVKPNRLLLTRAVLRQQDNGRKAIAHTKTRGEIAFTTKKIWAQKHTGNARHGAKSANLFRKGGITFGPRNTRNFTSMMPKKQRRLAIFSALSLKAAEKNIFCLDSYSGSIKTKPFTQMLRKLPPFENKKSLLIVLPEKNPAIQKSSHNLPFAKSLLASYLNPVDVLKYDSIMFVGEAVKKTEDLFLAA